MTEISAKTNKLRGASAPLEIPSVERALSQSTQSGVGHPSLLLGPTTVGEMAARPACLRQVISVIQRLEPDTYLDFLQVYYRMGLDRFGENWRYADIATVLLAATQLLQPESYLELGVRRGRSMAIVGATWPSCQIIGFDKWVPDYAGMPNPGPALVQSEMRKVGHAGSLTLIEGDSHKTLKTYLDAHPQSFFDLITVDGDHSNSGAAQDLRDVLPRLKLGGVLVFDDIAHPVHPYLGQVWRRIVGRNRQFSTWEFSELGFGVALAMRTSQ